ncbi:adenylyl-sulfate kinase [Polyangium aurulentum]|uniref:adenylyl-sulfate kinase n=1 Tax=Polyangium aurulentum TaxID=2567896 RepID=UPI0010ADD79B|nr:adenylyl-sulfate kinase [Polyangium aurulentum]UQA62551.1 adenylyl-sulfate kinase [Polyangium aurulentum]
MKGAVVWITGLPSAGKSVLAERTWMRLVHDKTPSVLLDGDAVRAALRPPPGYGEEARADFYETLANLAAMLARQGLVVLVPATAHRRAFREKAREVAPRFVEVYVNSPPETCAERDAKGLYAAAREGKLGGLPGVDIPYEPPESPDVTALGGYDEVAVAKIVRAVM